MNAVLALYLIVAATLAFDAVLLAALAWVYHAPRFAERRISTTVRMKVPRASRVKSSLGSSLLSLAAVVGVTYGLGERLFVTGPATWWRAALEAVGILLIYDFAYYWMHRAMHHKKLMRWVHGMHHRARNPSALESFYLHPVELLAGLALLTASTWLVGPVHVYAFAAAFFVYSTLNIVIHAGLRFPEPWLRPMDALVAKHHVHHMNDFSKNYASLTPLPDRVFGTAG